MEGDLNKCCLGGGGRLNLDVGNILEKFTEANGNREGGASWGLARNTIGGGGGSRKIKSDRSARRSTVKPEM